MPTRTGRGLSRSMSRTPPKMPRYSTAGSIRNFLADPRLDASDWFAPRHIGPSADERQTMLDAIGLRSLDALIDEVVPPSIRLPQPLGLPAPESEHQYLRRLTRIARRNKVFRSYIGLGYHDTVTPSVVLRMVFENPGWVHLTRHIRRRSRKAVLNRS